MTQPELIELSQPDFVTIDTVGPPGQRTFYLQAAQDDVLITLIIEKEQAAAMSLAISGMLEKLGEAEEDVESPDLGLIQPVDPLFHVGRLGLAYDETRDMLVITAEDLAPQKQVPRAKVQIWIDRAQMATLAHQAAVAVRSGRPVCPLCGETIDLGEKHICVRGNGRKHAGESA